MTLKLGIAVVGALLSTTACGSDGPAEPNTADEPPSAGLLVFMPFDNGAADASGNGQDGTLLGGATTTTGALVLSGNSLDAMSLPSPVLQARSDFTVAAFLRLTASGQDTPHMLSGSNANEDNSFVIAYREFADEWMLGIDTHTNPDVVFSPNSVIEDGAWHHVAVTRSGTSARLYLDGVPVGGAITAVASALSIDPGGLIVGQDQDIVGGGFEIDTAWPGAVDNLRIYVRALDAAEIVLLAAEAR